MSETGAVIKNYNGYYYVSTPNGRVTACKVRGRLKKTRFSLLTGDKVVFVSAVNGEGSIEEILPRKNCLLRPAVANIDQLVLVFASRQPDLNQGVLDRFLILAEQAKIPIVLCFSKVDLLDDTADILPIKQKYQNIGYEALLLSSDNGDGLAELQNLLVGKITVFAGLSGAGKSTLLNALYPGLQLTTGSVSEKIGRGRHTTRYSELIAVGGAYIVDTPGFSLNDMAGFTEYEIRDAFPEFSQYAAGCKFSTCLHLSEPSCAVKAALTEGLIDKERYQNYLDILAEAKGRRS